MKRLKSRPSLKDQLTAQARSMRAQPTEAEAQLWDGLRNRHRSLKFRRQQIIDRFIVDFYCAEARLVIEVDGEIHQHQTEADFVRQRYLEAQGLTVIRFKNEDVLQNLPAVLQRVHDAVHNVFLD